MKKPILTQEQASMLENHRGNFDTLMSKWSNKYCHTHLDNVSAEDIVSAFFDGYDVDGKIYYKIGDWVVNCRGFIGQVDYIDLLSNRPRVIWLTGDKIGTLANYISDGDVIRFATDEEIKKAEEVKLWKSIGREVGRFKIGDVGRFGDNEILKVKTGIDRLGINIMYVDGELDGFYPVESFISLGNDKK